MRGDVRRHAQKGIERECPTCGTDALHTLYDQYPAVLNTGAWGKYLNPVYLCTGCQRSHVHALFEYDPEERYEPRLYRYPPNATESGR